MEVVLIGKGPSSKLAPFKGSGLTTWGVNDAVAHRECDVCFFMDRHLVKDSQMDRSVTASVNTTKTPMYSAQDWEDIPSCIVYPKDEVMRRFGTDYFADSCAYMIALAIHHGFDHLHLYGFEYGWGDKYEKERPCVESWLGRALGMGIKVSIYGEHSALFKTKDETVYSYGGPQEFSRKNMQQPQFNPDSEAVALTVAERIKIRAMIPRSGSYRVMKFAMRLYEEANFTPDEAKKLNFKEISPNKGDPPLMVWDDNDIPPKEIGMTLAEKAMVASWLNKLDKRGELDRHCLGLYEKFCVPNDSG